jgi:hypothetical protein
LTYEKNLLGSLVAALPDRGLNCTKLNEYADMHDVCRNERGNHMHKSYVSNLTSKLN